MASPSGPNLINLTFESHEQLISHQYTTSINLSKVLKVSQGFLPLLCPITIFSDPWHEETQAGNLLDQLMYFATPGCPDFMRH